MRSVSIGAPVLVLVLAAGPAAAAVPFVGPTFGVDFFDSEGSSSVVLAAPAQADFFFGGIRPGLRVGAITEDGLNEMFLDTGFVFVTGDGESFHSIIATVNYARLFGGPYLTLGAGVGSIGFDGESEGLYSIGGGVGVRHVLSHGHGAVRLEARYDRLNLTEEDTEGLNAFGLKIGFDLMTR